MLKDRISKLLQRGVGEIKARGMQLPIIVCAATPGGSIFCARIHDGRPYELLAEHVGPDNDDLMAPVACMLLDPTGKCGSLAITAET
jgi:hypothetical protein